MTVRVPVIAFNAMTNLKPELIGLAAWLAASEIYPQDRRSIIEHVAEGGELDDSVLHKGFRSSGQVANAATAHAAWVAFIAELEQTTVRPAVSFHRNGNGHTMPLPPLAGGAPTFDVRSSDYDHLVKVGTDPDDDDIEF